MAKARRTPRARAKTGRRRSAKSKRKAARKVTAGAAFVRETLREVAGAPLPRAYWGKQAAKARRSGFKGRARGRLETGRDPLESVLPKLP